MRKFVSVLISAILVLASPGLDFYQAWANSNPGSVRPGVSFNPASQSAASAQPFSAAAPGPLSGFSRLDMGAGMGSIRPGPAYERPAREISQGQWLPYDVELGAKLRQQVEIAGDGQSSPERRSRSSHNAQSIIENSAWASSEGDASPVSGKARHGDFPAVNHSKTEPRSSLIPGLPGKFRLSSQRGSAQPDLLVLVSAASPAVAVILMLLLPALLVMGDKGIGAVFPGISKTSNRTLLRLTAFLGNVQSQHKLGAMYMDGEGGVKQDYSLAAKWLRKAAEKGHPQAQRELGYLYKIGIGVPKDYKEVVKWNLKAANQGDVMAQLNLGALHQWGRGVKQDDLEAYKWFSLAAAQGSKDGQSLLSTLKMGMSKRKISEAEKKVSRLFKSQRARAKIQPAKPGLNSKGQALPKLLAGISIAALSVGLIFGPPVFRFPITGLFLLGGLAYIVFSESRTVREWALIIKDLLKVPVSELAGALRPKFRTPDWVFTFGLFLEMHVSDIVILPPNLAHIPEYQEGQVMVRRLAAYAFLTPVLIGSMVLVSWALPYSMGSSLTVMAVSSLIGGFVLERIISVEGVGPRQGYPGGFESERIVHPTAYILGKAMMASGVVLGLATMSLASAGVVKAMAMLAAPGEASGTNLHQVLESALKQGEFKAGQDITAVVQDFKSKFLGRQMKVGKGGDPRPITQEVLEQTLRDFQEKGVLVNVNGQYLYAALDQTTLENLEWNYSPDKLKGLKGFRKKGAGETEEEVREKEKEDIREFKEVFGANVRFLRESVRALLRFKTHAMDMWFYKHLYNTTSSLKGMLRESSRIAQASLKFDAAQKAALEGAKNFAQNFLKILQSSGTSKVAVWAILGLGTVLLGSSSAFAGNLFSGGPSEDLTTPLGLARTALFFGSMLGVGIVLFLSMRAEPAKPKADNKLASPILASLPEDLKGRLIEAADQTLGVGADDQVRGHNVTHWSLEAVHRYRALGLEEAEIAKRVQKRLDDFLSVGRKLGYPDVAEILESLNLPSVLDQGREGNKAALDFPSKYDLPSYRSFHQRLGINRSYGASPGYYKISLKDAFDLALEIKDKQRAQEILLHMLRLGEYEGFYKAAEKQGNDQALIHAGLLSLVDFFYGEGRNRYFYNYAWDSIEALKRVQGDLKPLAEEILYDFGMFLSSPEFLSQVEEGRDIHIDNALRALRATGRLVEKVRVDSVKVDFITEVKDPKYAGALKALVRGLLNEGNPGSHYFSHYYEILKSLAAVRDEEPIKELARLARKEFDKPRRRFGLSSPSKEMRLALASIGDRETLNAFGEHIFNNTKSWGRLDYIASAEYFSSAGNVEGVEKVQKTLLEEAKKDERLRGDEYDGKRFEALMEAARENKSSARIRNVRFLDPEDSPSEFDPVLWDVERAKESLEEYRKELTPEKKEQLIREGYEQLRAKDSWRAFTLFAKALHRQGLIEAGDEMLRQKDGLNAWRPFLYASLLPR